MLRGSNLAEFKMPEISFASRFPSPKKWGPHTLVIFDSILLKNANAKRWLKSFPKSYGVKAGEKLKDIKQLSQHIEKIVALAEGIPARQMTIVVVGGGSVGDFGGFIASVYKRGVRLVHIPSTWLAVIDSAHGGKTALNVGGYKNQIGSFYQAEEIVVVRELLISQPKERLLEALNEMTKMSLIEGGAFWKEMVQADQLSEEGIWTWIAMAIAAKYEVVKKDPFEKSGLRQKLNLGHTMGHVIEGLCGYSHGESVGHGLEFALEWSAQKYKFRDAVWFSQALNRIQIQKTKAIRLPSKKIQSALLQDKKRSSKNMVNFIFIRKPGEVVIEAVSVQDILREARRQGLCS